MTKTFITLLALASLMTVCASPVRGAAIVNANEVGGNVVFAGGGTFNLTGLGFLGIGGTQGYIQANAATAILDTVPYDGTVVDVYGNMTSPGPFGSGSTFYPDLGSGGRFGVAATFLVVPFGYLSGSLLSASSTYSGMTFASMGITPGSYTWTWGSGVNADSFTLNIVATPAAVPESGSTAFTMLLALGALALLGRSGPWLRAR